MIEGAVSTEKKQQREEPEEGWRGCLLNLMVPYLPCPFLLSLLSCHLYHPFQEGRCDHGAQGNHLLQEGLGDPVSRECCRCTLESSSLPWPDCPEVVHSHRWQDLSRRARQSFWALEEKDRHQCTLQGGAVAQWSWCELKTGRVHQPPPNLIFLASRTPLFLSRFKDLSICY